MGPGWFPSGSSPLGSPWAFPGFGLRRGRDLAACVALVPSVLGPSVPWGGRSWEACRPLRPSPPLLALLPPSSPLVRPSLAARGFFPVGRREVGLQYMYTGCNVRREELLEGQKGLVGDQASPWARRFPIMNPVLVAPPTSPKGLRSSHRGYKDKLHNKGVSCSSTGSNSQKGKAVGSDER